MTAILTQATSAQTRQHEMPATGRPEFAAVEGLAPETMPSLIGGRGTFMKLFKADAKGREQRRHRGGGKARERKKPPKSWLQWVK